MENTEGHQNTSIPNRTTLDVIEKAEKGIGLNGPFESLDEMMEALKDTDDEHQKEG